MSNDWLTTGQMIDKLKVGEIAELEEGARVPVKFGPSYKHVTKNNSGDILWCTSDRRIDSSAPLMMYGHTVNWKWHINPNYVSFEEAMKEVKEGKTVYFHPKENEQLVVTLGNGMSWFDKYFWEELIHGKWTVKEGEQ